MRIQKLIGTVVAAALTATVLLGGAGAASAAEEPSPAKAVGSVQSNDFIDPTPVISQAELDAGAVGRLADDLTVMTGNYEYICIGIDGNSWSLRAGENTWNCKGSFLQKYLDGRHIATYKLAWGGGAAAPTPPWNAGCVLAVSSTVALFIFPPTGATAWVVVGGLTAAGLYVSCKG